MKEVYARKDMGKLVIRFLDLRWGSCKGMTVAISVIDSIPRLDLQGIHRLCTVDLVAL